MLLPFPFHPFCVLYSSSEASSNHTELQKQRGTSGKEKKCKCAETRLSVCVVQLKGLLVLRNCLSSVHYCDDHSRLHFLNRSANVLYSDIHSHLLITSRVY